MSRWMDVKIFELKQKKGALENMLKSLNDNNFELEKNRLISSKIFELTQEKLELEIQRSSFNKQEFNNTRIINKIKTNQVPSSNYRTIILGAFFGFIFSVFIIFTREIFLNPSKDK